MQDLKDSPTGKPNVGIWNKDLSKYSPFRAETLETKKGVIDIVVDNNGKKFVLRPCQEYEENRGFVDQELAKLERLGINIPEYSIVKYAYGNKSFSEDSRMIVDYVDGEAMKVAPNNEKAKLANSLFEYYKGKFFSGEDFLYDISSPVQYLYGSVNGGEKKIYMVDIEFGKNASTVADLGMHRDWYLLDVMDRAVKFAPVGDSKTELEKKMINFLNSIDSSKFSEEILGWGSVKDKYNEMRDEFSDAK